MRRTSLFLLVRLAIIAGLIVGPVLFASHQQKQLKNFRVVKDGVLYRSGQMTDDGLRRAVHEYGIRTVVSLRFARGPGETPPDSNEVELCRRMDLRHVRIPPRPWEGDPARAGRDEPGVRQFLKIMNDPANYPVLIHCFAGTHRTGAYCAVYRMEFEGWSSEQALQELKSLGYGHVAEEGDIFGYLSNYKPHPRTLMPDAIPER